MPKVTPKASPWVRGKINAGIYDGINRLVRTDKIAGLVYGGVGVHPSIDDAHQWSVTVLSVRLIACYLATKADACKVGEVLQRYCCLALQETDEKKLIEKLPGWVKPWLLECAKKRAYIPPPRGI